MKRRRGEEGENGKGKGIGENYWAFPYSVRAGKSGPYASAVEEDGEAEEERNSAKEIRQRSLLRPALLDPTLLLSASLYCPLCLLD